ncbi:MAG: siroheme synthase CysG [Deltaproteobacteria bacterium]|nr:siroheme synthase CysG [Deltaproteobacteria bacterium]
MPYLPIFLNIRAQSCLVVGGGEIAARKASLLLKAGAVVTVVSPQLTGILEHMAETGRVQWRQGEFSESDLDNINLVIAATNSSPVNISVHKEATVRGIPVNVVDNPELCTFVMPAIIDRNPLLVAVSTGGASPTFSRLIRTRLEQMIPSGFGRMAALAGRFRQRVKDSLAEPADRRRFWEHVLDGPISERLMELPAEQAAGELERALAQAQSQAQNGELAQSSSRGCVYLVGAGPGNPDMLTLGALRIIGKADVVVYDRLVSLEVLEYARRDAELIFVGKEKGHHNRPQEEINDLLVELGRQGKQVVRLKGGDPLVFGRGGEEALKLISNGIQCRIIPGMTAAVGCAATTGIPLTHRGISHSCMLVTGHLKDGVLDLNWEAMAHPRQTLVIYMGLTGLDELCSKLISHGLSGSTPAACIEQGTTPAQRVIEGTLENLPQITLQAGLKPPVLTVIGEVVGLRSKINPRAQE